MIIPDFSRAVQISRAELLQWGYPVHSKYWQGLDISNKKEAEMMEVLNWSFGVIISKPWTLDTIRQQIKPNLPWADLHFEQERVGGQPLNPGETWKQWPYANSADKHRTEGEQFNHTYAERFWPKFAGRLPGGFSEGLEDELDSVRRGIRYRYADLNDVVDQLVVDPFTRQAYIPIWFPEDGSHRDRKPCTLGYHLIMRENRLNMIYYIRSCDIVRHFQDDVYLAVRLLYWILDECRADDPKVWNDVKPGTYTMHITSLHCFKNDLYALQKLVDGR